MPNLPPAPLRQKILDRFGAISRPWSEWFNTIYQQIGGVETAASVASDLTDHINDSSSAHAASAIGVSASGNLSSTDAQAALVELQTDIDTRATSASVTAVESDLTDHLNDTVDAHDASAISYDNSTSGLTATDVNDAIDEVAAAGGGSGGVNYLEEPGDFENGTTGISTYDDTGTYVDGTGGSPSSISTATTTTASEVLEGSTSLKISKAASDASGEGVTLTSATIDKQYRGSELVFSLSHDGGSANYNGSDISIKAYDVTNGEIIRNIRPFNVTNAAQDPIILNESIIQRFAIQTKDTTEQVRISLHIESDSVTASSWDLVIDDVKLSPETYPHVSPVSDWRSYTPTTEGIGTPSNVNFRYKVQGDTLYIRGSLTTGTVSSNPFTISLPSGYEIDAGGKVSSTANIDAFGAGFRQTNSSTSRYLIEDAIPGILVGAYDGTNTDKVRFYRAGQNSEFDPQNANDLIASNDGFNIPTLAIPIADASANEIGVFASPALSGWRSYTPTFVGLGTVTQVSMRYKVVGDAIIISGSFKSGTASGVAATFTLPDGYTIDTDKIDSTAFRHGFGSMVRLTDASGTVNLTRGDVSPFYNWYHAVYNGSTNLVQICARATNSGLFLSDTAIYGNNHRYVVYDISIPIADASALISSGVVPINKYQVNYLSSNITADNSDISDLKFENLTVGKHYRVTGQATFTASSEYGELTANHDGAVLFRIASPVTNVTPVNRSSAGSSRIFMATTSTVTFAFDENAATNLIGDGTSNNTFVMLEELNNYQEVSSF